MQHGRYPEVPDDFGHWLAGFIDGEGCFCITRRNYAAARHPGYNLVFNIAIREDDRAILDEIRAMLGVGRIHAHRGLKQSNPALQYRVADKLGLLRIVEVFEQFPLRAKKSRDFDLWKQAVRHYATIQKGPHVANWGPIPELYAALKASRAYRAAAGEPSPGGSHPSPRDTQLSFRGERGASVSAPR